MDAHRVTWNKQQHFLQNALSQPEKHPEWRSLFLSQHTQVHSHQMSHGGEWSFEDELLNVMDDISLRAIPLKGEHSIAWIIWHLARCEDLTTNMLIAGNDQIFERQGWKKKLRSPFIHTGNEIGAHEILNFNDSIDLEQLKAYRVAVGVSTQQVVNRLTPDELSQKVRSERMDKVKALEVVLDPGILNYWSRRTIAGLLLMPPTRHCFTHLNEAQRIRYDLHLQ